MSHFAKIENGIVTKVIVAEQEFIDKHYPNEQWIQTSYNTHAGKNKRTGVPIRKNYAGIGMTYDEARDAFIPVKPYESWLLNDETCLWESPIPYPNDKKGYYEWVELEQKWKLIEQV